MFHLDLEDERRQGWIQTAWPGALPCPLGSGSWSVAPHWMLCCSLGQQSYCRLV